MEEDDDPNGANGPKLHFLPGKDFGVCFALTQKGFPKNFVCKFFFDNFSYFKINFFGLFFGLFLVIGEAQLFLTWIDHFFSVLLHDKI